jgi:hypothetical protein
MTQQQKALGALQAWLEDNIEMQSSVCFDNNGEINSEVVHQALMSVLNDRPHDEIVKQHLVQSQFLHAQVLGLRRVHDVHSLKTEQLMAAIELHASSVFVPPCTHKEPYCEFHYHMDNKNTLWALLVVDESDHIHDVYLHQNLLNSEFWSKPL